jgi:hypothetical protein
LVISVLKKESEALRSFEMEVDAANVTNASTMKLELIEIRAARSTPSYVTMTRPTQNRRPPLKFHGMATLRKKMKLLTSKSLLVTTRVLNLARVTKRIADKSAAARVSNCLVRDGPGGRGG